MQRASEPLSSGESSWTWLGAARSGDRAAREELVRRCTPVVRAYLAARWRGGPLESELDDAAQEVLIDCLRAGGALERSDPERPFRPFLRGVARTVALRFEQRHAGRAATALEDRELEARESHLSVVFDRAFAREVMREASEVQRARAQAEGGVKLRRVELLELRFQQGRTIAEIAKLWGEDPARVHHLYADARADFRAALREVVARRNGGAQADLERECDWMLAVLRRNGG